MKRMLAFVLCALGMTASAKDAKVTLETQLEVKKPGAVLTVGPTQALFMPPKVDFSAWGPSPVWADGARPVPKAYGTPEGWKGLKVDFRDDFGRAQTIIRAPEGTDFYGTGEVLGPLRRNGTTVTFWNTDNYGYASYDPKRLYQSHPWVMGVRPDGSAFGVLPDCTYRGSLTLTETEIRFDFEGPVYPVLIMEGKDPADVMRQLAERTGHMALPPLWALGYQQSRWGYRSAEECLGIAKRLREGRIPTDVLWMDIDYMRGYRVFTFDPKGFPNPKGYMDALHDLNFRGVWMIDPGIKKDPEGYHAYAEGEAGGHWVRQADGKTDYVGRVWPGECKFPDFTRSETRDWWASLTDRFVSENNIDGIWNDMNEPAVFGGTGHTMPPDNFHRGDDVLPPGPHVRYHNVYGLQMIRATREGILRAHPDRRPFVLTRASFLGGQRYGATWTGDNLSTEEHMRLSVPMTLTLGLSGQPFNGPDLGGFGNHCTPELMRQWVGFGAFFPFCRNHSASGTKAQEPWAFGKETEDAFRTAIERRYALLPYIYTAFREASVSGAPVLRPVFFADPADPTLRREEQAFLLGGDLLIVPSFAKNPTLPKGTWRDVQVLGTPEERQADQARLLLRPGAALPVAKPAQHTGAISLADLTLVANPDASGRAVATLYEDAGDGFGYKDGDYRLTRYTVTVKDGKPEVSTEVLEGKRPTAVRTITVRLAL